MSQPIDPQILRARTGFLLSRIDPDSTPGYLGGKKRGEKALAEDRAVLAGLQERLYAAGTGGNDPRYVLLVLQAMDTAGKGGIVSHVVGATDPNGVHLASFKKPTPEELAHDFLWRVEKRLPPAGMLGVFDRSHYEDVLIGRVRSLAAPAEIERRYGAIVEFESRLAAAGATIIKVMLHISSDEQRTRLGDRLDRRDKQWKYNPGDVDERLLWPDYQNAYQIAIERTSTDRAPWYVVPANHKWYARLAVQSLLIDAFEKLNLGWPEPDYDVEVEKARLAAS